MAEVITETIIIADGQFGVQFDPPLPKEALDAAIDEFSQVAKKIAGYEVGPVKSYGSSNGQCLFVPRAVFGERVVDIMRTPEETKFGKCAQQIASSIRHAFPEIEINLAPEAIFSKR